MLSALIPLALLTTATFARRWKQSGKSCFLILIGIAPVLAMVLFHKIHLAPVNSFYALNRPEQLAANLIDFDRQTHILIRFI